jgi:5-methylcytosine-specific restriction endonuclease McrA
MRYPRIRDIENRIDKEGRKICRNCESIVPSGRRSYCSNDCMTSFVRSNYWYFVRKDVLKRDNYRCSICRERKRKRELDVDHIIPVQMGGQLLDKANLRTLCKECHKAKSELDREALSSVRNEE